MKFFEKRVCCICNSNLNDSEDKIIADGYLCSKCYKMLSPWFKVNDKITKNQILLQLAWRKESLNLLSTFCKTKSINIDGTEIIQLDEEDGSLLILRDGQSIDNNPDVFNIREIRDADLIVEEHIKTIEQTENNNSYKSRHYKYSYNYFVNIILTNPFIPEKRFSIIDDNSDDKFDEYVKKGSEVIKLLTNKTKEPTIIRIKED